MDIGGGPRVCPGMNLAFSEATFAIAVLVSHFDMELACPESEIKRIINFTTQPNKMPIYIRKRKF